MTKHLRFLIVLLMTLVWSAVMFAQKTETITIADYVSTTDNCKEIPVGAPLNQNGFKIYIEKKNTKTNPGLYKSDNTLRFYNTDILHIESSNGDVTSVEFTYLNNNKYFNIKGLTSNTWSGTPSASLSFTASGLNRFTVIKITYTESSSSNKTDTKVSFDSNSGTTFTFTEGEYSDGTFTAPTATETTGVAGTITYSSNNESAVKVNASTGELSFPGYGEATITAIFTPNDAENYAVSTDWYKVKNEAKKSDNILTFSGELKSFDNVREYEKTLSEANVTLNGSDGKTYIFISNGGKNGSARFLLPTKTGKLQSPTFPSYINGYNVVITYGIGGTGYPSVTANGKKVTGTVKGDYNKGTGATLSLDVADGSAFTVTSGANALAISKIEITPNAVDETETITLNETATNNTIVAKTGVNVTLKRTMAKGVWNTICLPFGLTSEQITTVFGEGVKVAQLDDTSTGATLKFVDMTNTGIEASVPYLIKPVTDAPAEGYKFEGVEITEAAVNPTKVKTAGGLYFNGVYNMVDATAEVTSGYKAAFLGKGNTVFGAQSGTNMKGFRAYFAIPNGTATSALRVNIDGTATSIKSINSEVVESNAPVYNLQGQRVDGNNLTPGIYVKAGKKFVVK